jgi:hypothetical protein
MAGFSPCLTIESARVNLPSIAAWSGCQQQQSWITRLSLALASSRTIDLEQVLWLTIYIYCICVPQQGEFPICLLEPFFEKPWTDGERIPSYDSCAGLFDTTKDGLNSFFRNSLFYAILLRTFARLHTYKLQSRICGNIILLGVIHIYTRMLQTTRSTIS